VEETRKHFLQEHEERMTLKAHFNSEANLLAATAEIVGVPSVGAINRNSELTRNDDDESSIEELASVVLT
jgi:hypothetical protein